MGPAVTGPLSPTQEEAYRIKCIELTTRMKEVATENEQLRLRKTRLTRGIKKMRLERAILLDSIKHRMPKDDADENEDEETEDSSDSPPTPQERPLRTKKSHRRITTSPPLNATSGGRQGHTDSQGPVQSGTPTAYGSTDPAKVDQGTAADSFVTNDLQHRNESEAFHAYASHLAKDILPTDPHGELELKNEFNNDYDEYARKKWGELPDSEKQKYERDFKVRGRKGGRTSKGASNEVEMKDAGD